MSFWSLNWVCFISFCAVFDFCVIFMVSFIFCLFIFFSCWYIHMLMHMYALYWYIFVRWVAVSTYWTKCVSIIKMRNFSSCLRHSTILFKHKIGPVNESSLNSIKYLKKKIRIILLSKWSLFGPYYSWIVPVSIPTTEHLGMQSQRVQFMFT